jgi:hypothetical protein
MENNLESKKGYDKRTMQRNRVCDMLRSFFRQRECHTLIVPAAEEGVLQNIEDQQKKLRPEFLQQVLQCYEHALAIRSTPPFHPFGPPANNSVKGWYLPASTPPVRPNKNNTLCVHAVGQATDHGAGVAQAQERGRVPSERSRVHLAGAHVHRRH